MPEGASERKRVFINVPFDDEYTPLFYAILFAIRGCGLTPCCALDKSGSGEPRLTKILNMAQEAALSIHDLSRVGLDSATGLPRFNMPFELGICLGYRHVRDWLPAKLERDCLVFDRSAHRYEKFISDLKGNDIVAHHNIPKRVIYAVRDFLREYVESPPKSGDYLYQQFRQFIKFIHFSQKSNKTKLSYIEISEIMEAEFATWDLNNSDNNA